MHDPSRSPNCASLSDDDLVSRCQRELPYNTNAFEQLVRRFHERVFHSCLRYLGSVEDAEEVAQDVFLRVFHALPRFEGRSAFRTWLFRIVANECATRYRKVQRRLTQRATFQEATAFEPAHTVQPEVPSGLDLSPEMNRAWQSLRPSEREVLMLRHVGDLSIQEVADTIALGLSATKMRLYRSEERLRAALDALRSDRS